MLTTARKTLQLIRPDGYRRWAMLVTLAVVVSIVEAVGAGLVFTLLGLAANPEAAVTLPLLGDVSQLLPQRGQPETLALLAAVAAVFFVVRAGLIILQAYARSRISENTGARMASRLVAGYLRMPYAFHLRRNSAELIRNTNQTVAAVIYKVLLPLAIFVGEVLMVVALLAFLLSVEPVPTLGAAAVMALAVTAILLVVQPRLKHLGHIMHITGRSTLQLVQQSLHGIREIRLLGREEYFSRRYREVRDQAARAEYRAAAMTELPRMSIETTMLIFILGFLGFTVLQSGNSADTIASLGILAYVGMRIQPSLQKIVNAANSLRYASSAIDDLDRESRLLEMVRTAEERDTTRAEAPIPRLGTRLAARGVSFTYQDADSPAVTDIDLVVEAGSSIGICGPTGGGKSTLISLLTGLLEPDRGAITVDGADIAANVRSWQSQLGVVSQEPFLIDDTLRRNIALGVDDADIDEEALGEAITLARLDDFIASLPDGLDTVVGERGTRVSGGQRQRVAIARALYRRPAVIVLDEGTSALDGATEAAFMQGIEDLRGEHTLVMVAHRLSTVQRCDRIYLVADGRIADQGTYEELAARNAMFQAMAS